MEIGIAEIVVVVVVAVVVVVVVAVVVVVVVVPAFRNRHCLTSPAPPFWHFQFSFPEPRASWTQPSRY